MQLFRTICVVVVLGALTYGAYVTLTGSPPLEPPLDAVNWSSPPHIELPAAATPPSPAAAAPGAATAPAPKFVGAASSTPALAGAARLDTPTDSVGGTPLKPTITDVRPSTGASNEPPLNYPSTGAVPGPFDTANSTPLNAATTTGPTLPGISLSTVPDASATPVTPVAGTTSLSTQNAVSQIQQPAAATPSTKVPLDEIQTLAATKPAEALERLSRWFDDPSLSPDENRRVTELLDYLAGTVVYSREHLLEPPHTVQPGERLDQIAAKYAVPWELLAKINGIADPANLVPGTQLKVIRGPFGALVDKSRRQLSVFVGPLYAGSFTVGFGQDRPPVDGQFAVVEKALNRNAAPGTNMPVLNPNGPTHWLDLGNGLAIHTSDGSASLDNDQARGCIRLNPGESADVFDILSVGTQVIIRP